MKFSQIKRLFKRLYIRLTACYRILRYGNFEVVILGRPDKKMNYIKFHCKNGYATTYKQDFKYN